jgi:hypothetical protein
VILHLEIVIAVEDKTGSNTSKYADAIGDKVLNTEYLDQ